MGDRRHHHGRVEVDINVGGGRRPRPQPQNMTVIVNKPARRPQIQETIVVNQPTMQAPRRPRIQETIVVNQPVMQAPRRPLIQETLVVNQPVMQVPRRQVQETIIVNDSTPIFAPPPPRPCIEFDFSLGGGRPPVQETIIVNSSQAANSPATMISPIVTPASVYNPPTSTIVQQNDTVTSKPLIEFDINLGGNRKPPPVQESIVVNPPFVTPASVYVPQSTTSMVTQASISAPKTNLDVDINLEYNQQPPQVKETFLVNQPVITPASVYVPQTTTVVTKTSAPTKPKFELDINLGGNRRPPPVKETIIVNNPGVTPASVYVPQTTTVVTKTSAPTKPKFELDINLGGNRKPPPVKETIIVNNPGVTPASVYVPQTTTIVTKTSAPSKPKFELDISLGGNKKPPSVNETIIVNNPGVTPASVYVPQTTTVVTKTSAPSKPKFELDISLGGNRKPPPVKETIIVNNPSQQSTTTIVTSAPPPKPKSKFEIDVSLGRSRPQPPQVMETVIVNQPSTSTQTTIVTQNAPPPKKSWLPKIEFGIKF